MEKDRLNTKQFCSVEVPEFLFDLIKKKIEEEESKINFRSKLLMAASLIVFFVNLGVMSQYESNSDTIYESDINPYTSLNYSYYE